MLILAEAYLLRQDEAQTLALQHQLWLDSCSACLINDHNCATEERIQPVSRAHRGVKQLTVGQEDQGCTLVEQIAGGMVGTDVPASEVML